MKDRFECPEAPKDDFDLGVFGREYRLLGSRLRIGAGTTGKMSKHPRAMIKVELRGKDLGIRLSGDEKGVLVLAEGKTALSTLKEMICHLYQIIVREKIDIRDLELVREAEAAKAAGGDEAACEILKSREID